MAGSPELRIGPIGYGLGVILSAMLITLCAHGAMRNAPIEWADGDPHSLGSLAQFDHDWRVVRLTTSRTGASDQPQGTRIVEYRRKRFGWRYSVVLIVGPGDRIRHASVTSKSRLLRLEYQRTYALDALQPQLDQAADD